MELTTFMAALKVAIEALRLSRRALGKRKHDQLVSAAIAELLKELPDIDAVEARLKAAKATGIEPDMNLLRAQSMLLKTRRFHGLFDWRDASPVAGGGHVGPRKKASTKKAKKGPRRSAKSRAKSRRH
jgi:hypothetical protein